MPLTSTGVKFFTQHPVEPHPYTLVVSAEAAPDKLRAVATINAAAIARVA